MKTCYTAPYQFQGGVKLPTGGDGGQNGTPEVRDPLKRRLTW